MHWIALRPRLDASSGVAPDEAAVAAPAEPLRALGWWALQYTPRVALLGDAVLLEVSGSMRLWGGLAGLLRQIETAKKPVTQVDCAQGDTSLIAYARLSTPAQGVCPPDALPLHTLLAAQPHLVTLARLGCATWGQLRALPRAGLARRFGAALLDALDQAYGQRPDVYPWLVLPEAFVARLELPGAVDAAPALLFGARRLLAQLRVWLRLRHCGVLALELGWQMDTRRHTAREGALVLRVAEPAQDTAHLQRLLGEHLARVTLPAPALWLTLRTLQTQPLTDQSASLLPDAAPPGDTLAQLIERLSARLGAEQVLHCRLEADHRPERMQAWVAALNDPDSIATIPIKTRANGKKHRKFVDPKSTPPDGWISPDSAWLPTWLLQPPLRLCVQAGVPQYHGPLTLLAGPQRLEAAWWDAAADTLALRDYFLARSATSALLWVYRERLPSRSAQAQADATHWYLHGVFA